MIGTYTTSDGLNVDENAPILSPDSRGGSTTKFSGMFPYVDVRLTDDVLDVVNPRLEFSVFEYGTGLVCRG